MENSSIDNTPADNQTGVINWSMVGRVTLKALLLFALLNIAFSACRPLDSIGNLTLYNHLFRGRDRLPYGEVPAEDFNLTLNNLPAMFAAHSLDQPKAADEYRVLIIGDSSIWGWFLENEDTLSGQLNRLNLVAEDGRRVAFYNLGYPVMSLTKDLLLLDEALERTDPDLILWPVTMQSFARSKQLEHPLLHENAIRVRELIARFDLLMDPSDPRLADRDFWGNTLFGRRRDLADLIRLQTWGLSWTATGHDQAIPADIPLRTVDFDENYSWLDFDSPGSMTEDDLAVDVLRAGVASAGTTPVVIINEPMFVSNGRNSDIRYNAFYPRWAYDDYRELLEQTASANKWDLIDLWDAIPPEEFTDTPVHLTPEGTRQFAAILANRLSFAESRNNDN